jgi:hypothetical protein
MKFCCIPVNETERDICSVAEKTFNAKMEAHNRKVALFIRHYTAHVQVELRNTDLPVNITFLQSFDQEVMGSLCHYKVMSSKQHHSAKMEYGFSEDSCDLG